MKMMNDLSYIAMLILFCLFVVIMYLAIRKNDKEVKTLKDLFKPSKPALSFKVDNERLKKLNKEIWDLNIQEKLFLYRGMLGTSYKALIRVTGKGIEIEGLGSYVDVSDEERDDITG